MTRNPLVIHKSDPSCLARYKAERIDGIESENEAAKVGSACARACEALAYEEERDRAPGELFAVARQAVEAASLDLAMSPPATERALAIMERALAPTSRLRFGRPTGWESSAEWHWALDKDFRPIKDGDESDALCAGTIDLVVWNEAEGRVVVTDDKTTLKFQRGDDLVHAWEPRVYALAAIQVFGVKNPVFRWRNLRHGYVISSEKVDPRMFHVDGAWYEATKSRIRALRAEREAAVEMGAWTETLGPDCVYCPVKHKCAAMREAVRLGRVADLSDPTDVGRRALALRALATYYETEAEALVESGGAPIGLGQGVGLGMRPATKWALVERFDGPENYDRLMAALVGLGMTDAQRVEWFRYCRESDVPGRVKDALYELLGSRVGGKAVEDMAYVMPTTRYEFGPWLVGTGKRADKKTMDEILDGLDW